MKTFIGQEIEIGKRYVYLKNERTGSSTTRKLKMIGTCTNIDKRYITFNREKCPESTYWDKAGNGTKKVSDRLLSQDDVICESASEDIICKCFHDEYGMCDFLGCICDWSDFRYGTRRTGNRRI